MGGFLPWGVGVPLREGGVQAYEALLNRLTPAQRQGMPGAASDRDVAMFRGSLPQLWNTEAGRKTIVRTLKALNDYKIERAQISEDFAAGDMSLRQYYDKLRAVKDPFSGVRDLKTGEVPPPAQGAPQVGQVVGRFRFLGGNPRVKSNWSPVEGAQ